MEPADSYRSSPAILLFADTAAGFADHERRIHQLEGRLAGTAPIAEAIARLDEAIDVGAVIVDASGAEGDALERLLDRLNLAAREGRHASVVSVTPDLIDLAAARAPHPGIAILSGASESEHLAALAAALAARTPISSRMAEPGLARLKQLSDEVGRIARTLAAISEGEDGDVRRMPSADTGHDASPPNAGQIRSLIRARRLRDQFFSADLFADPAWDILLDLAAARLEGARVAVSSLCIAAAVPATTALRWIKALTEDGMLLRVADPQDGRRVFIELSDPAAQGMNGYFQALSRSGWLPA